MTAFHINSVPTSNATGSTTTQSTSGTTMDPRSLAALATLIQQLAGGGTSAMRQDRAARNGEIASVQGQREGYTKDAAFTDSQGAMNQNVRLALEKMLPDLVRASEGAGTSQNSMRALLMQKGANQAAESASALGLNAAAAYGGVSNQMSSILQNLTAQQDPATTALLQALQIARGAVTNSTTSTTAPGNGGVIAPPSGSSSSAGASRSPMVGYTPPVQMMSYIAGSDANRYANDGTEGTDTARVTGNRVNGSDLSSLLQSNWTNDYTF